jgi:hypothetical protein
MRRHSKLILGALATALSVLPGYLSALSVSNSAGVVTSTPGATTFANFDSITDTAIGTVTGGALNGGTNPGGGGNWIYTDGGSAGPVTVSLTNPASYVGFLWGSMDSYNSVAVYDGSMLLATIGGGTQGLTTGFVNITAGPGQAITSIVETSGACCFETDNYAAIESPVPLPASVWLLLSGLVGVGAMARKWRTA